MAQLIITQPVAMALRLEQPVKGLERVVNEVSALALRLALGVALDDDTAAATLRDAAEGDSIALLRAVQRFERATDSRSSAKIAERSAQYLRAAVELTTRPDREPVVPAD